MKFNGKNKIDTQTQLRQVSLRKKGGHQRP